MQSMVYETVLRPSVCLSYLSTAAAACVGFAAVGPAGSIDRLLHGASAAGAIAFRFISTAANASSVTFLAAVDGWTQTC